MIEQSAKVAALLEAAKKCAAELKELGDVANGGDVAAGIGACIEIILQSAALESVTILNVNRAQSTLNKTRSPKSV